MVPSAAEPPVVPLTDQVTALFVVPETATVNPNESPARMLTVAGDTTTLIELVGGGGGEGLEPRVVAEQPAAKSAASMPPSWSNLRISENTHREPLNPAHSVVYGRPRGYWTKGQ